MTLTFDLLMTFDEANSVKRFSFYYFLILSVTSIYSYMIQGCQGSFMWCYLVNFTNSDLFDLDLWTLYGLIIMRSIFSKPVYLLYNLFEVIYQVILAWNTINMEHYMAKMTYLTLTFDLLMTLEEVNCVERFSFY